jgi:prevent-host-death family protein
MEKTMGAFEARRTFGKLLQAVRHGDRVVVQRNGEPVAAVVPIELYEQWKRRREAFFDKLEAMGEEANLSEEEAQALVEEAIAAIRAQDAASTAR